MNKIKCSITHKRVHINNCFKGGKDKIYEPTDLRKKVTKLINERIIELTLEY